MVSSIINLSSLKVVIGIVGPGSLDPMVLTLKRYPQLHILSAFSDPF